MAGCIALLLLAETAFALQIGTTPTTFQRRASYGILMYGKLPNDALVPRGKVSMNPFDNLKQMQDQRVAGASHILLAPGKCTLPIDEAKAMMEGWKSDIMASGSIAESFAEKAKAESHCPTAANGGNLGFVVRASCSEDFNKILFDSEPGAVYGPLMTPAGLHLIYVASCREPVPNEDTKLGKMPWQQ